MAFRSYSAILASLLLSSLIAAPAAAVCKSPKNICKHIDECLQRTSDPNNKAAEQIREGVRTRNGRIVWAGAEATGNRIANVNVTRRRIGRLNDNDGRFGMS